MIRRTLRTLADAPGLFGWRCFAEALSVIHEHEATIVQLTADVKALESAVSQLEQEAEQHRNNAAAQAFGYSQEVARLRALLPVEVKPVEVGDCFRAVNGYRKGTIVEVVELDEEDCDEIAWVTCGTERLIFTLAALRDPARFEQVDGVAAPPAQTVTDALAASWPPAGPWSGK